MELYRRLADEEDRQQKVSDERFQKVKERLVKAEHAGVEKVLELLKKSKAPKTNGSGNESVGSTSTGKELGDG